MSVTKLICIGPPGTGKTRWGISLVSEWISRGTKSTQISYLAFTTAAAEEAALRISDAQKGRPDMAGEYPYFRTIHSLSYLLMRQAGITKRVVLPGDMKKFATASGLKVTPERFTGDDMGEAYQSAPNDRQGLWDRCKTAYSLSRLTSRTVAELDAAKLDMSDEAIRRMGWRDRDAYRTFVSQYENYKAAHGLVDFTDMLEHAVRHPVPVPCRKVIVDEAQDLCPLHFAILDRLFENSEEMWMIGDDDQALFKFSGASADEFLSQISGRMKVVLRQTHRFGQKIVDLSERIIRRVKNRIEKNVIGAPGKTGVITETGELPMDLGDAFVLHRHVAGCQEIGRKFMMAGLPFTNERGHDPLSSREKIKGFSAIDPLSMGARVPFGAVVSLVETLMPSMWRANEKDATNLRLLVHGAKTRMIESPADLMVDLADLVRMKVFSLEGADVVKRKRYDILKFSDDLRYYERLVANKIPLAPGGPTITTIHGSKGREKEKVVVFTESSRRCWIDPDTEHRLAYVAATRAREELVICREQKLEWTSVEYEYPISGSVAPAEVSGEVATSITEEK